MTEPDPIAALAAQLETLRGQLARYTGETGALRARLEEFAGQDMVQLGEIRRLSGKVDEAISKRDAADPPAPFWLRLDDEEYAARLAELRDWVERFARIQYPGYFAKLPLCWEAHPDALWELSTLMTEWVRIYGDPDSRPLADALVFHDRYMPGVLDRLAQAIKCDATGCRMVRSSPWERSPPPRRP
jgi:hypothetical protein